MSGNLAPPLFWKSHGESPQQASLPAWSAYTGQSADAAQNWGWLEAVHPDDREQVRNAWKRAIRTPATSTLLCCIRYLNGDYQRFKVQIIPAFDNIHRLQSWFVYFAPETAETSESDEHWESRRVYRTLYEQTVAGVFYLSLDGNILQVNPRFCELMGCEEEELLSWTLWNLGEPGDISCQVEAMHKRLSSGESQPVCRARYRRKDGEYIWVRVTQFLLSKTSGEPDSFLCFAEDIDLQVQAEDERAELLARVQESHQEAEARASQMEAIFESITDGILVCDAEGKVIHSNAAVSRILQKDGTPEFVHRPPMERLSMIQAFNEQGQKPSLDEWPLPRLLRGEKITIGDLREILPNGEEIYTTCTGSTMRDKQGKITGAVLVIRDITERHRLEEHVRRSSNVLLALAEKLVHIPGRGEEEASTEQVSKGETAPALTLPEVGQYLVEIVCRMLEYQSATIALIDPQTDQAHPLAMTGFSPQAEALLCNQYKSFPLANYMSQEEIARLRSNEAIFWNMGGHSVEGGSYQLLTGPMTLNERLVGILCLKKHGRQDYTPEEICLVKAIAKLIMLVIERERLQQEWLEAHSSELALREANRRFDEFLSIASHELRTPLAGIKGNIQLAQRRLGKLKAAQIPGLDAFMDKLEDIEDYLRHAEHRVNVQNRMISDLLDVSRIQANKLELVMGHCDLITIVHDAVEDQHYNAPGRLMILSLPEHCEKLTVNGDADRLGQVIHNYLTNALKYSPADKPVKVEIGLEEAGRRARVSVTDEGPGLTPEERQHVWERFYRVKGIPVQSGSGPGLGLGLHISRMIVKAHHGKLGLTSTPGVGSTFWFELPLAEPISPPSQPSFHYGPEQVRKAF